MAVLLPAWHDSGVRDDVLAATQVWSLCVGLLTLHPGSTSQQCSNLLFQLPGHVFDLLVPVLMQGVIPSIFEGLKNPSSHMLCSNEEQYDCQSRQVQPEHLDQPGGTRLVLHVHA